MPVIGTLRCTSRHLAGLRSAKRWLLREVFDKGTVAYLGSIIHQGFEARPDACRLFDRVGVRVRPDLVIQTESQRRRIETIAPVASSVER